MLSILSLFSLWEGGEHKLCSPPSCIFAENSIASYQKMWYTDKNTLCKGGFFVNIREMKYFLEIANCANYTVAAQNLYVSQPALSKVIHKMESELGFPLFFAQQRKLKLTDNGKLFYNRVQRIIHEYDSLSLVPQENDALLSGDLYLGFPVVAGICFFCDIIAAFSQKYPHVRIHIKEEGSQRITTDIASGNLDIGCVTLPASEQLFHVYPFVEDRSCLLVSNKHPLSQRDHISLKDLSHVPLILLGKEFSTHHDICTALREEGVEPNITMLSSQWDFIVEMVRKNYGVAFLPQSLFRRFSYPDIHLLEINHPIQYETLALITKKDGYSSQITSRFLNFAVNMQKKADNI